MGQKQAYHREDVRRLVRHIVQLDAVLGALVVPRNDVLRYTLKFFESKADKALETDM